MNSSISHLIRSFTQRRNVTLMVGKNSATRLLLGVFMLVLMSLGHDTFAQQYRRVYATTQSNSGSGDVSNPLLAVDGNLATASLLEFPTLFVLPVKYQTLTFPTTPLADAPASTDQIHIKMGINGNILAVGASVTIQPYNGSSPAGTATAVTSFLSAVKGTSILDIEIPAPGEAFTAVRVTTDAGVDLGGSLSIYEAYINKVSSASIACNGVADVIYGNAGALVGGLNGVTAPQSNVADGNDGTSATLNALVSATGAKTYATALFNSVSQSGDIIRVLVGTPPVLLDAAVLSQKLAITTYLGNTATNVYSSAPIISINLLAGGTLQEILIPAPVAFDRIEVSLANGLLQALGALTVYEIGTSLPPPAVATSNVTIYTGKTAELSATTAAGNGLLWEHAAPAYSSTANPYTTPVLTESTSYTVKSTRAGCTNQSATATANVTVLPVTLLTLPTATLNVAYTTSTPVVTTIGGRTLIYELVAGQGDLPNGISLNTSTGVISGTSTVSGSFPFKVKVTDITSPGSPLDAGTFSFTLVVQSTLAITGGPYPSGIALAAYEEDLPVGLGATGGVPPYSYVIVPPEDGGARTAAIVSGLTLNTSGQLSGTPSTEGEYTFTIRATDSEGSTVQANFTITIEPDLPVTLVKFNATSEGSTASLSWSTSVETNSDRFEIERSQSGKNWSKIGSVSSSHESNSLQYYSFVDSKPLDGQNLYRLKMIDLDQTFAYSHIENVNFASTAYLYPNPVKSNENLNFNATDWTKIKEVKVINAIGKTVFEATNALSTGISTKNLAAGIYVVKMIHTNGSVSTHKFVRQ
jgi:hypothetical protein